MDFDKIQQIAQEKIAQIGELLDVSDAIARGERPAKRDQMAALKISIDSRLKLLQAWKPQDMNVSVASPVRIIYERISEAVPPVSVGSPTE